MTEQKKVGAGLRRLGKGLLWSVGVLCVLLACFLGYILVTAPYLDRVDVSPQGYRTTVLDDRGETILTLMGEASNRVYVTIDQIPKDLQNAVVAIEDQRFYRHHGVDLRGVARAAYRNLSAGRLSEGASTLTQQLIKNNVFTGWTQEKTALDKITRKLQEQYLALQLERRESKDWILENYLNTINLGSGTWGVQAAFSGMALAGKSGTTTELRDLWFVGYSPYYACGVWGGYDDFSAQSSSAYVKKLWRSIMEQAHQGLADQGFSGTRDLEQRVICVKCGNLAVEGLCEDTVQGDMTRTEYYTPGTEPGESCDCHVAVSICRRSGQAAGAYCPAGETDKAVYLTTGTAGTADESAVAPAAAGETCQVHRNWWNWLFPEEPEDGSGPEPEAEEPERPGGFWSWFGW